jgi:type II secretory pathway pseudopilin PulG
LVVVVIIGILGVMILPNFTTGADGARLRTASRGVMQMVRYARTMAVLQQTPMDLVISSGGELRVERRGGASGTVNATVDAAVDVPEDGDGDGGGTGYVLAELNAAKTYERVAFRVRLDERELDEHERDERLDTAEENNKDAQEENVTVVRIPFESNGRCLPFVVAVQVGGEDVTDEMTVTVDRFGVPKITDGDE